MEIQDTRIFLQQSEEYPSVLFAWEKELTQEFHSIFPLSAGPLDWEQIDPSPFQHMG